jgi:lipopolysaccharide transport system permease protein
VSHLPPGYELVIRRTEGWFTLNVADVWRYRDLLLLLVRRDFVAKYRQTLLGPAWFLFQPLLMTAVFVVVFGNFARIPTAGVPPVLFYLGGLLAWSYFAQNFQAISATLSSNAAVFGKVYFPRLVVPISSLIATLLALALQVAAFAGFWIYFKFFTPAAGAFGLTGAVALLPLLVVQIAALSLGTGLWLAAVTVKYRDFAHLNVFLLQVWLYATPIVYTLSDVPERWRWVVLLNPMAMPVESIRYMLLGQGMVPAPYIAVSLAMTAVLLVTGLLVFTRIEKTFIDTV